MFFESISFEKGKASLLEYHYHRMRHTIKTELSLGKIGDKQREKIESFLDTTMFFLRTLIPPSSKGYFKCRVTYNPYNIDNKSVKFIPYELSPIKTLQLVDGDNIIYDRKYSDRSQINRLFKKRGSNDDILIVRKGMITDSSYCNILFFDGKGWVTPPSLLPGVQKAFLLDQKMIREIPIKERDIFKYKSFKLINALRGFNRVEAIPIKNIHF